MVERARRLTWAGIAANPDDLLDREWLLANALGGYASGTVGGVVTRRYHGLLVAALPAPLGRVVMLNHLLECLTPPGGTRRRRPAASRRPGPNRPVLRL